jgi:ribonucleoside-diphosphate reductase alpha chain
LAELDFLPNSPALLNAGQELGQLSACFVLTIEDSIETVFEALKETAIIHKSGGGTGFSFSNVRPKHDCVGGKQRVAGGPVALLEVFSKSAGYLRQGGVRRGCNSAVLNVEHPDILDYIQAKDNPRALENFYISVVVSDDFMERVKRRIEYDLINPRNGKVCGRLNAGEVFDGLVDQAWKTGDPGLVFIDRVNRDNPTPKLGKIENVSGCGEQTLLNYESCTLGSINLVNMLGSENAKPAIDYAKLEKTVEIAVRFLDNIIDINKFPLSKIETISKKTRKIGLGCMGFADMLMALGIPYDSDEALNVVENVMCAIHKKAHKTSSQLAVERGSFPAYEGSVFDRPGGPPMRNASCITISPSGTLSIIAGCSSGIEPSFAMVFVRNILEGEQLLEVNPQFEKLAIKYGFNTNEVLEKLVTCNKVDSIECIPDGLKRLFTTAHQVTPEWHVKIQASFQKYTDNAVSKTVNFPEHATREDMRRVFLMAYESGLKGITAYRDGSRELQPLAIGEIGVELARRYVTGRSCTQ